MLASIGMTEMRDANDRHPDLCVFVYQCNASLIFLLDGVQHFIYFSLFFMLITFRLTQMMAQFE